MLLTKIDLLPYVPFDAAMARENARKVHPAMEILEVSSTTGAGLNNWLAWLTTKTHKNLSA
jgi:hydrogenase nickel incorporation protein HypB